MDELMHINLYKSIKAILELARSKAYSAVNFAMVEAYWNIGRMIVEKQDGEKRSEYGAGLLKELSKMLTDEYGKGFTIANLKNMRQFYINFPNSYALRSELTWTHYRLIMRVEAENARNFYLDECIKSNWSTRQLERQINTFFYERLLSSQNKDLVSAEIYTKEPSIKPQDITMLNEFVEKILVHKADKTGGERAQQVDIHLSFIGNFDVLKEEAPPTPEELEEQEKLRQKRAKQREANTRWYAKKMEETERLRAEQAGELPPPTLEEIEAAEQARLAKEQAEQEKIAQKREYKRVWAQNNREQKRLAKATNVATAVDATEDKETA